MSGFSLPKPHPNLARNGFDLSSRRVFSAPAGALLPVGTWEVNPSEHFEFRVQDLTRTQPLNTAAFARCKEYYHFFFVPYRSLWRYSDQFFTGVSDAESMYYRPQSEGGDSRDDADDYVPRYAPHFDMIETVRKLHSLGSDFTDALGYSYENGALRLLNLLGYGNYGNSLVVPKTTNVEFGGAVRPSGNFAFDTNVMYASNISNKFTPCAFRLLAYQKIFNDFYRNKNWLKPNVISFNVDYINQDSLSEIDPWNAIWSMQLRYRQYSSDLITSALPSANYQEGIFNLPNYFSSSDASVNRGHENANSAGISLGVSSTGHADDTGFTVNDIRAAFALDKMLEATRRANGLDYSNQIAAHYGFNVPDSRRNRVDFIGGFDNTISISEVLSTSESLTSNDVTKTGVGDMYGKGIGAMDSGKISYDVKEHGVIMCIYSILPQTDYNAFYLDPMNRKLTREDYFQPEFQNLGMQPIVGMDFCFSANAGSSSSGFNPNSIMGYTSRYSEYKTARDVVFGEFMSGRSLNNWVTPRVDLLLSSSFNKTSEDASSRGVGLSSSSFLVNPSVLDPVFSVRYNGSERTDQFMINSYFDVKAVRPMSVSGLPSL